MLLLLMLVVLIVNVDDRGSRKSVYLVCDGCCCIRSWLHWVRVRWIRLQRVGDDVLWRVKSQGRLLVFLQLLVGDALQQRWRNTHLVEWTVVVNWVDLWRMPRLFMVVVFSRSWEWWVGLNWKAQKRSIIESAKNWDSTCYCDIILFSLRRNY